MYPVYSDLEMVAKEIHEENLRKAERARLVRLAQRARSRNVALRIAGWIGAQIAALVPVRLGSGMVPPVRTSTCVEC